MLKKTITFTDYFGETRTQDFYFNLSKAELLDMNYTTVGGMQRMVEEIQNSQDQKRIYELFKTIVLKAYGEKSADGYRFIKSPEISEAFSQTEAYSELMMEFFSKENAAADFIMGIVPADLRDEAQKQAAKQGITGVISGEPKPIE